MSKVANGDALSKMNASFLEEYRSTYSINKYTKKTAGHGISYLLDEVYGKLYLDVLERCVPKERRRSGIRLLEFGCGGGMNLIHLTSTLERCGVAVESAYGTDFSDKLLEAARHEADQQLPPEQARKLVFCPARNEALVADMTARLGVRKEALLGSFDLIIGVNTIRYCHRLEKAAECADDIRRLLREGGACVVIDMNQKFPAFRSRFRDRLTLEKKAYYLPSLKEYTEPFAHAGLEVLESRCFSWVPHSAGPMLTSVLKGLTPVLDFVVPNHAMRSLVISQKKVSSNN